MCVVNPKFAKIDICKIWKYPDWYSQFTTVQIGILSLLQYRLVFSVYYSKDSVIGDSNS